MKNSVYLLVGLTLKGIGYASHKMKIAARLYMPRLGLLPKRQLSKRPSSGGRKVTIPVRNFYCS